MAADHWLVSVRFIAHDNTLCGAGTIVMTNIAICPVNSPTAEVSIVISKHYIRVVKDILCDVMYSTLFASLPSWPGCDFGLARYMFE